MENKATWIFVVVALLWALTFPLIGNVINAHDPFIFVTLRFFLAAAITLPIFFKRLNKELLISGFILGILNCGSYLCQTIGLKYVNSSRAAFITGTYVIFVPFIAPFFKPQRLSKTDLISAIICTTGLYVLTGADLNQVTYGDYFVLLCSIFVAISISYVARLSAKDLDPLGLATSQILFTSILSLLMSLLFAQFSKESILQWKFLSLILYCSIFSTILTFTLQIKYQKYVPTQKVAVIFCLEPVFATIFDFLINQTPVQKNLIFGGLLILSSILVLELKKYKKPAKIYLKD